MSEVKCPGSMTECNASCGMYVDGRGCALKVIAEELAKRKTKKKGK